MKVAFIAPNIKPLFFESSRENFGGAEVQQMLLVKYLVEKNHQVKLLVRKSKYSESPITKESIDFIPFSMNFIGRSKAYFFADFFSLALAIIRANADIYVMKLPRILLFFVGFMVHLRNKKLIFWLTSDRDVKMEETKSMGGHIARFMYSIGLCSPHLAITQNAYQQERCSELGLKSIFLPSLAETNESDCEVSESVSPKVLWVGSHSNKSLKRLDLFLKFAKSMPDIQFQLICRMVSRRKYRALKRLISSITNVEYIGQCSYSETEKYFREAFLFLSTSEMEGFPNTFLQSWANGIPVVSLWIDPDSVIENEALGICTKGNFHFLKSETRRLILDKKTRLEFGSNARRYVQERHSLEETGPLYIEMFSKLMAK